jgi:hypothetical protein
MKLQNEITINKHSLKMAILYMVYRILLDVLYIYWVNPIYDYSGFLLEVNMFKLTISYGLIFIFIMIIPKTEDRVSYMILQLHFIVMIIPLMTTYAMANMSTYFMMMISASFAMQIILIRNLPLIRLYKIKNIKIILICVFGLLTVITYFYLLKSQKINLSSFDFNATYDIRAEQNIDGGLIGYLISWQFRIINPALIIIFYLKKYYKLSIIIIGLQVLLYLMVPHKEVILSIGLIFIILYLAKKNYRFDYSFINFLCLSSIGFVAIYEYFKNLLPFAVLPVRLLFEPARIKFQHYEFFSEEGKLHYSEGMIGKILGLDYPYTLPSGYVVSGGISNSNTGYLAYAYDNAGFIGMLFMSLLFVFILLLIDSLIKNEKKNIVFALLIYPMIVLNDGDLLTLLLTGGFFLLIIILFVFNDISDTKSLKGNSL